MNLENIFYDLKNEVKEFLPKRFFIALKELKNKKVLGFAKQIKEEKL